MTSVCPEGKEPRNLDVVIILSNSSSMRYQDYYGSQQLPASVEAITNFISEFPLGVNKISLLIAPQYEVPTDLSGDEQSLIDHLGTSVNQDGNKYSNISDNIDAAWAELSSVRHTAEHKQVLIIIDDGLLSTSDPLASAAVVKDAGAQLIVVSMNTVEERALSFNTTFLSAMQQYGVYEYPAHIDNFEDLWESIASPDDYYNAYDMRLNEVFINLAASIQECVATSEEEKPDPDTAERPPEQKCPQDECSGWNISKNDGEVGKCDPQKTTIEIKMPPHEPPQPPPPQDINIETSEKQYKNICTNVVDNGDYEDALRSWNIVRNDGYIDVPWSHTTNSNVFRMGFSGSLPETECTQVIDNPDFEIDANWNTITVAENGHTQLRDTATCNSSLMMSRTLENRWSSCGTPNDPPVTPGIDIEIDYPCSGTSLINVLNIDILSYCSDSTDDALTLTSVTQPPGDTGSVIINPNGTVLYTAPNEWPEGIVSGTFNYTVADDRGKSATGTVTITCPEHHVTIITDPITIGILPGADPYDFNLTSNVTDTEGHSVRVKQVQSPGLVGSVVNNNNGIVTFYPDPAANDSVSTGFTYEVEDIVPNTRIPQSVSGSIIINYLNSPPVVPPQSYNIRPPLFSINLLDAVTELDDDTLELSGLSIDQDTRSNDNAAWTISNSGQVDWIIPDPFTNPETPVVIKYTVYDGQHIAFNNLTLTFSNAVPVTPDQSFAVTYLDFSTNVLDVVTDEDTSDALQLVSITDPTGTSLPGTFVYAADGAVTWTNPSPVPTNPLVLNYTVTDGIDESTGTLTFIYENAVPVTPDQEFTVLDTFSTNVLDVVTDLDGTPQLISIADPTGADLPGSFSYDPDGSITWGNPGPVPNPLILNYTVSDGTDESTGTLTFTYDNAVPVTPDQEFTATYPEFTANVLDLVTDTDSGDVLQLQSITDPTGAILPGTFVYGTDGSVVWNPPIPLPENPLVLNYTVTDGSDESTGTLTFNYVNSPPVAPDQEYDIWYRTRTLNLLDDPGVTDAETPFSLTLVSVNHTVEPTRVTGGVVDADGTFSFNVAYPFPTPGVPVVFQYQVSDGTLTADGTLTLNYKEGSRGLFMGGFAGADNTPTKDSIYSINVGLPGSSESFSTLSETKAFATAMSNGPIGDALVAGGYKSVSEIALDRIEHVDFYSGTVVADYGTITARYGLNAVSNGTNDKAIIEGGTLQSYATTTLMETITCSTGGAATSFGNITPAKGTNSGATSNGVDGRGMVCGGYSGGVTVDLVVLIYFAVLGAWSITSSGLTQPRRFVGVTSNGTSNRGIIAGGRNDTVNLQSFEYRSFGLSGVSDTLGNLSVAMYKLSAVSNGTANTAVFAGGVADGPTYLDTVEYAGIISGGNAVEFGSLAQPRYAMAATSNA